MKYSLLLVAAMLVINSCIKEEIEWSYLYIGTYTGGASKGIYLYRMNQESGELKYVNVTEGIENPSYLAIDGTGSYLYAVKELTEFEGKKSGAVSAYKIDKKNLELEFLNQVATEGGAPCHLTIDANNNYLFVANYVGGNACSIKLNDDGSLGKITGIVQHEGSGPDKSRQKAPHAHSVNLDKNNHLYVADLGIDKIMIYNLSESGELTNNDPAFAEVTPGAGPRHFTFHPKGNFAYVISELGNTVTAYNHNHKTGALSAIGTYSTLPENFEGESYCADIHIHPNGKFLYGSNRGHNSIAIFNINEITGELTLSGNENTKGSWPRNFTIDPTGKFLIVANQKSDDVFVFKIDSNTGLLEYTEISTHIPSPVCLVFD